MTTNQQRIIDISKKLHLSHIGSNLSCLPILEEIYRKKKSNDIVILDSAHAHLAHLIVRHDHAIGGKLLRKEDENFFIIGAIEDYGIHCDRQIGCDASGGSLGHGLGIGIGYALADRKRDVYVIVSDGSMMEGSNWEALRIIDDLKLTNIHIHCNFNGNTAVARIDRNNLYERMILFVNKTYINYWRTDNTPEFSGVEGHYKTI